MAEALAALGIVSNILQLVDFGTKVLTRLREFQSNVGEIPESFHQISNELPLILDILKQFQGVIDDRFIEGRTDTALCRVIDGCFAQVTKLDDILAKYLPNSEDSRFTKGKKAIFSLRKDENIELISKRLHVYVTDLTFYCAFVSSTQQPSGGKCNIKPYVNTIN